MYLNQLKKNIRPMLDSKVSIELLGPPGVGKSDFVEQTIANQTRADDGKEWGLATMFLATQTPPDLIGYQFKGERTFNGKTVAVTEPSMPLWMFTTKGRPVWEYERGILFLDEYGQAEPDVKRASAELLLNRRLGPWELPDGWSVISASNRSEDRSGVTKAFDFVINRRLEIHIKGDVASWLEWANEHKVDPMFMAYAKNHADKVFNGVVPSKQGPWCTPRSLMLASEMMLEMGRAPGRQQGSGDFGYIPTDDVALETAQGLIGEADAQQLFALIKLGNEMPPFEDILKDPMGVKVPREPGGQMLVMYNLASRALPSNLPQLVTYMQRLPEEFSTAFVQTCAKRDARLLREDVFKQWMKANSSLVASVLATM